MEIMTRKLIGDKTILICFHRCRSPSIDPWPAIAHIFIYFFFIFDFFLFFRWTWSLLRRIGSTTTTTWIAWRRLASENDTTRKKTRHDTKINNSCYAGGFNVPNNPKNHLNHESRSSLRSGRWSCAPTHGAKWKNGSRRSRRLPTRNITM